MAPDAIAFRWTDDGVMAPLRPKEADKRFVCQSVYWLAEEQQRSMTSHAHQFAWLNQAWKNLPESIADDFPTPESLRKRALIETGWFTETLIDVGSKAAAQRVAAFARAKDEFAHVVTRGVLVVIREAKSQSVRAMGARDFQKSKDDVLGFVSGLIGVSPDALGREAGRAA